jgi:uncharacterized protein (DUF952 family)/GNAT superfamily N-acetyltransferase
VVAPLLHISSPAEWRAALDAGVIAPPSLDEVGFVHLSAPGQVALPAQRLYTGRTDLMLLALDPAAIGVEVRWEPGVPTDPASMRFPHAYGPVSTAAVLAVLPYRPDAEGGFDAPQVPAMTAAARLTVLQHSVLRRAATSEVPVTGGVAVLTAPVAVSHQHNQLLIDGEVDATQLVADADRVLGAAGLAHRTALLSGPRAAGPAAELSARGCRVEQLVGMSAPAGGEPDPRVEHVDLEALRPMWDAGWRRSIPAVTDAELTQLTDRYRVEEAVVDLRCLAVRVAGRVVASCLLKIDGATAELDAVNTDPEHRGRGHGDAMVATARAVAADAGCDLVGLSAAADGWPGRWYARRGFAEVTRSWSVELGN